MRTIFTILLTALSLVTFSQTQAANYSELFLDSIFAENKGTFVLYDLQKDSYQVYKPDRAKQKFPVHSTSKIFWSIIGLEENLISSETDILKWDSVKYPKNPAYQVGTYQDQTIVTALKYSVNWYYFELLKLMTPEMIEKYLNNLAYQKGYHVEKIQYFGLTFTIKKSAFEQIYFLKSLYLNEFNLSTETLVVIKKGMHNANNLDCTVYTKSGTGPIENDNGIAWLIGWVEKDTQTYFFAFNLEDEDEITAGKLRNEYAFRVLKALNLIDK